MTEKKGLNYFMSQVMTNIYSNNNLCKLFYYTDSDPLGKSKTLDAYDWMEELKDSKIIHAPFTGNISKEAIVQMNLSFSNLRPIGNGVLLNGNLIFTVLCHQKIWSIKEGWRTNEILEELKSSLDNERIGVSLLKYNSAKEFGLNQTDFMGYTVIFDIKEFNKANKDKN